MIKRNSVVAAVVVLALAGLVAHGDALGEAQQRAFVEGELVLRLTMDLPIEPEQFFDAWTTADQLVEWFPSQAEMTVTEGGEYVFSWDGWDEEWRGTYIEVDHPSRLVFTWLPPAAVFPEGAYETTVTLTFEEIEGATRLVLEHGGFQGGVEMESHLEAWRGYLYNLRAFLLQRSSGG